MLRHLLLGRVVSFSIFFLGIGLSVHATESAAHSSENKDITIHVKLDHEYRLEKKPSILGYLKAIFNYPHRQWTFLGQVYFLGQVIEEDIKNLHREGDSSHFDVSLVGARGPLAAILLAKPHMILGSGFFHYVRNRDQFAGIIAHEMTHRNKDQLAARKDDPEVGKMLRTIPGFSELDSDQREEVRADLGAVDRLIEGGYNPWGIYEAMRTFAVLSRYQPKMSGEISARATHPASDLRMQAIKLYIIWKGFEQDLSTKIKGFKPFGLMMKLLWLRSSTTEIFRIVSTHKWLLKTLVWSFYLRLLFQTAEGSRSFLYVMLSMYLGKAFGPAINGGGQFAKDILTKGRSTYKAYSKLIQLQKLSAQSPSTDSLSKLILDQARFLGRYYKNFESPSYRNILPALQRYLFGYALIHRRANRLAERSLEIVLESLIKNPELLHDQKVKDSWFRFLRLIYSEVLENRKLSDLVAQIHQKLDSEKSSEPSIHSKIEIATSNSIDMNSIFKSIETMTEQLPQEALELLSKHFEELYRFVYSSDNHDYLLTQRFRKLMNFFHLYIPYDPPDLKKIKAQRLIQRKIVGLFDEPQMKNPIEYAKATAMFSGLFHFGNFQYEKKVLTYIHSSLFSKWSLDILNQFREDIQNKVKSIRDLKIYIDNLRYKFLDPNELTFILNPLIQSNPDWIQNQDDIKILLKERAFWIRLGSKKEPTSRSGKILFESLQDQAKKFPIFWTFSPDESEILHTLILEKKKHLKLEAESFTEKLHEWIDFTERGITATSDALFQKLFKIANDEQKDMIEVEALSGRLWDPNLRNDILRSRIERSRTMALAITAKPNERLENINLILDEIGKAFPEKGDIYDDTIEWVSKKIESSEEESSYLDSKKSMHEPGEKSSDFGIRVLSALSEDILSWKKSDQWKFFKFLRGDIPATPKIMELFSAVGPERVKRVYESFPSMIRASFIDTLLDSPRGLLYHFQTKVGWGDEILTHLTRKLEPDVREIVFELLSSYFHALNVTGNKRKRSYVLAYMLASDSSVDSSVGRLLKEILEYHGTVGVKLTQMLAALGIFSDEDTKILRTSQDRSREPMRETIYSDLRKYLKVSHLPFRLKKLLGAASIKYAVLAEDDSSADPYVVKVLRKDALPRLNGDIEILREMGLNLIKKNPARYGFLKGAIGATIDATKREMHFENEIDRSKKADEYLFREIPATTTVNIPKEELLASGVIRSSFARGVSFFNLDQNSQETAADGILNLEVPHLRLTDSTDTSVRYFCPDRHGGNSRICFDESGKFLYSPFDWGQLMELSAEDHHHIIRLFALSEIAARTGSTEWLVQMIQDIFPKISKPNLKKVMKKYFKNFSDKPIQNYFSILSAIEFSLHQSLPTVYYDYIRGLIQLNQYQPFAKNKNLTPYEIFKTRVEKEARSLADHMKLSTLETIKAGLREPNQKDFKNKIQTKVGSLCPQFLRSIFKSDS